MKIVYCDACGVLLTNQVLEKEKVRERVRVGNDYCNDVCMGCVNRLREILQTSGWKIQDKGLIADACTRTERHDGPCNGLARTDCPENSGKV